MLTRYEINGHAVTTGVYAVYAAQMIANLQRERDELAAKVERVEAALAEHRQHGGECTCGQWERPISFDLTFRQAHDVHRAEMVLAALDGGAS